MPASGPSAVGAEIGRLDGDHEARSSRTASRAATGSCRSRPRRRARWRPVRSSRPGTCRSCRTRRACPSALRAARKKRPAARMAGGAPVLDRDRSAAAGARCARRPRTALRSSATPARREQRVDGARRVPRAEHDGVGRRARRRLRAATHATRPPSARRPVDRAPKQTSRRALKRLRSASSTFGSLLEPTWGRESTIDLGRRAEARRGSAITSAMPRDLCERV